MKVKLGYACITNCINDSSSSPYTYSEYLKDGDIDKLDRVIISNLKSLNNIIDYNIKNNIHFYRISSACRYKYCFPRGENIKIARMVAKTTPYFFTLRRFESSVPSSFFISSSG